MPLEFACPFHGSTVLRGLLVDFELAVNVQSANYQHNVAEINSDAIKIVRDKRM